MVTINLAQHEWLKTIRSKSFYKNLTARLFLGIVALYTGGMLLFLGFSLNKILEEIPGGTPMELFNGAMLYLLLIGLVLRFIMQQLNTINLPAYQALPIKRSTLINYLLLKPLASPANYMLLLVVIPFAIRSVAAYYSGWTALRFVIAFELMVWCNSLLAAVLKRRFGSGILFFLLFIVVIGAIFACEYFHLFSLFGLSKALFGFVVLHPMGLFIPIAAVCVAYLLNRWFFALNYYTEHFNKKLQTSRVATADLSFLNRFGIIGELISVQIKLILRHKRTRSMMFLSVIILLYGLLFYGHPVYSNGMLFFCALFTTGIPMLVYGQLIISWDSAHFDGILTKNIPVRTYILSNYYLLLAFNIICFVLTTPYFLFGSKIIYMHVTAFLFNTGFTIIFLLFFATFNNKRIDLSRASTMNYQGTTYKSFLITLPILFLPWFFIYIVGGMSSPAAALWILAGIGLAGLILHKPLLNVCVNQFNNRKYSMAEGFRDAE